MAEISASGSKAIGESTESMEEGIEDEARLVGVDTSNCRGLMGVSATRRSVSIRFLPDTMGAKRRREVRAR